MVERFANYLKFSLNEEDDDSILSENAQNSAAFVGNPAVPASISVTTASHPSNAAAKRKIEQEDYIASQLEGSSLDYFDEETLEAYLNSRKRKKARLSAGLTPVEESKEEAVEESKEEEEGAEKGGESEGNNAANVL